MDHMKVRQSFEIPHEGNESMRAARQKIDDVICELTCRIQSLKTKRNELSPIYVLPPEILSKIFILIHDSSVRDPSNEAQFRSHHALWIRVGHVCHHWREIALNYPSLWSIPVFTRPGLAQEMMQRSKMAPLTIRSIASTRIPKVLAQLENALIQITRIQSIELTLKLEGHTTIFSLLSQPTPLLENLFLSSHTYNQISFPPDTLSDAPRLRSIGFNCLNFSWESAIFKHRSLTALQLSHSHIGASTVDQMMDALHYLPNLRILALSTCIPPHTTSNGNERTLEFKFLERLELSTRAVDCIFLLRHIQYPSHATVKLQSSSTKVEDGVTIFSLIGQRFRCAQSIGAGSHHSPVVIRSARLISDFYTVGISFFNRVDSMEMLSGTVGLDPIIKIRFDGGFILTETHDRLLTTINNCFDLSSLEGLLLDWSFTHDHICVIRDSLGKLPKLKIINISQSLPHICIAIAGRDEKPKNNQTTTLPHSRGTPPNYFPPVPLFLALRTLIVQGVDFQPRQHPVIMERLTDMLIKCSNIGAPIDNLSLEQCREVRNWQMGLLGELVVNLEVGGKVIDVRELEYDGRSDEESDENEDENDY